MGCLLQSEYRCWSRDSALSVRHAGVQALAAIVSAYPYTVPSFMPDVLMCLCPHGGEKQPISVGLLRHVGGVSNYLLSLSLFLRFG